MYKNAARFLRHRRELGDHGLGLVPLAGFPEICLEALPPEVLRAYHRGTPVTGTFAREVRGGFLVEIEEQMAFCPSSEVTRRSDRGWCAGHPPSSLVTFIILKLSPTCFVVSERRALEREGLKVASEALAHGQTIVGTVESAVGYGAFIDIGGVTGLLHVTRMFVTPGRNPRSYLGPGDRVRVQVTRVDRARHQISLAVGVPLDSEGSESVVDRAPRKAGGRPGPTGARGKRRGPRPK